MRTLRGAAAALLLAVPLLVVSPSEAQTTPQGILTLDGIRALQTLCGSKLSDGSIAPCHITVDTTGVRIDPATKQLQQQMLSALGSPLQAGGSIGLSGSLPTGANVIGKAGIDQTTPGVTNGVQVNASALPAGAASAANQTTELSTLATIATNGGRSQSAATSTPLAIPATTSATTYGPWTPQLARDVWLSIAITGGTASISVVQTTDGVCADGYQISLANATYIAGAFASVAAGRYREKIGQESQSGAQWCVTVTPAAGASVVGGLAQ